MLKINVLYISSAPLSGTTGGSAVMHNHLMNEQFDVYEINNNTLYEEKVSAFELRLRQSPFHRWYTMYRQLIYKKRLSAETLKAIKIFKPDVIITVAHGDMFWLALNTASRLNLPCISVFHDWWPLLFDQEKAFPFFYRKLISYRFRKLYQKSDCVLCVSEGMKKELGAHPRVEILYPCTSLSKQNSGSISGAVQGVFKLLYAGNIDHSYGRLLQSVILNLPSDENIQFTVLGNAYDWPAAIKEDATKKGILKQTLPNAEFVKELEAASAFLVVLGFDEDLSLLMKTNFPSKIATYSKYNKPIIIWGPSYATGVVFMKEHDCGIVIETDDVNVLMQQIINLKNTPIMQNKYAQRGAYIYEALLNPTNIQKQFIRIVSEIAGREIPD